MILIGEKLNSSIPSTRAILEARDAAAAAGLAAAQEEAGAEWLDLNAGMFADEEEAERLSGLLDWERALVRIAGAARYLTRHRRCDGRVGIVGFGLGGGLAFAAASRMPELGAVVAFYGLPVKGTFDPERVTAPVLAHFAARDPWARPERGKQIQDAIRRSHGQMSLCVYEADHAFVNDSRGEVYAANLATLAWDRTMVFLQDQLGTGA